MCNIYINNIGNLYRYIKLYLYIKHVLLNIVDKNKYKIKYKYVYR